MGVWSTFREAGPRGAIFEADEVIHGERSEGPRAGVGAAPHRTQFLPPAQIGLRHLNPIQRTLNQPIPLCRSLQKVRTGCRV